MPTISTLTVDVETNTSKFSTGLKVAAAGLATLAAGATYAFKEFEDSEKIAAQTDAVLKSTGNSANTTAKHISDLADALAMKAGIDDEEIQAGENMILTFKNIANEAGKGNDIFDQTTKVVTDMSVAMGQDFKSSAIQVGKALNDPIAGMSALSRVGVTFDEQQKKQIATMVKHNDLLGAQKVILQELTSEFGGSAAAQATASGKMQVALGNLAETAGKLLAPAFTFLINKVLELVSFLQDNAGPAFKAAGEWFANLWDRIKPVAEFIGGVAVDAWNALTRAAQKVWPEIKKLWDALQPLIKVLGVVVGAILAVALKAIPPLIDVLGEVIKWIIKVVTAFLEFANDVGGVVTKVVGFFARLFEGAREKFGQVIDFIKDIPGKIKDFFANAAQWLYDAGRQVLIGLWNGLKSMFATVWNGLTDWVGGLIDKVKGFLHIGSPSKVFYEIGQNMMAGMDQGIRKGAFDVQGTLRGLTPGFESVGMSGGGGDIVLQVSGQTFAKIARDELLRLSKRNNGTGL